MSANVKRDVRLAAARAATVLFLLLPVVGCGGDKSPRLQSLAEKMKGRSPAEMVAMAFDPDDADNRRQGVTELSSRSWGLQEPYLKGYATMVRNDDDPLVRSAAVRALGKAGDLTYLPDVVAALEDDEPSVRWDAAVALDSLVGPEAVDPLRRHAVEDEALDVRASAARALRHYPTPEVVAMLKRCLRDRDFSVRYQARASLAAIMGRDFGYEPGRWPEDPAAVPPAPKRSWWDRVRGRKATPAEPAAEHEE